jgi:hypothetical protein
MGGSGMSAFRILRWTGATLSLALILAAPGGPSRAAEPSPLISKPKSKGYQALQMKSTPDGKQQVRAKLRGGYLDLTVELTDGKTLFNRRALSELGVEMLKTTSQIPTATGSHSVYIAKISDLEFGGRSIGPMEVRAADLDAILGNGAPAPDGFISMDLLARHGAVIDVRAQQIYLKLR